MKQGQSSTKRTGVKHLTWQDRHMMETLVRRKWPFKRTPCWAELGRDMGRSARSVRGEYLRGKVTLLGRELEPYGTYSAEKGQAEAERRHANKGAPMRLTSVIAEAIRHHIVGHRRSPSVALEKMRKEGGHGWLPRPRTLCYAIENGRLELVREHLPYGARRRRRPKRGKRMAYARTPGKPIDDRPGEADARAQYGHWEMGTVAGPAGGSGACLLALTERATRGELIIPMPDRTRQSVRRALGALARSARSPFRAMRSLTPGNGSEFRDFASIEAIARKGGAAALRGLFYAHPCCPHERGSNENANRLIRRWLPKGTDFAKVPRRQIQAVEGEINTMERAVLGWKSALERKQEMLNEIAA
jgi:IS30 family transposase